MTEEDEKDLSNLMYLLEIHHINSDILVKMKNTIQKQQEELKKKDKIIDEMAKCLKESNFDKYCNTKNCTYENEEGICTISCIKQYFEKKVERSESSK